MQLGVGTDALLGDHDLHGIREYGHWCQKPCIAIDADASEST